MRGLTEIAGEANVLHVKVTGRVQGASLFTPLTHLYLVETTIGDAHFTTQHRYNDFVSLHAEMLDVIVGLPPVFPVPKLSLHLSSSLDERTSHLQFYCNALVAFCAVANEPPPEGLMRFLGALPDPGAGDAPDESAEDDDAAPAAMAAEHASIAALLTANAIEQALMAIQAKAEGAALCRLQRSARRRRARCLQAGGATRTGWSLLRWLRTLPLHVLVSEALVPPPGDEAHRFVTSLTEARLAARLSDKGLGALAAPVWRAIERLRRHEDESIEPPESQTLPTAAAAPSTESQTLSTAAAAPSTAAAAPSTESQTLPTAAAAPSTAAAAPSTAAAAPSTAAAAPSTAAAAPSTAAASPISEPAATSFNSPIQKFTSGREAAAAALAAARAGNSPLVSPPGSEVTLMPIKFSSGREAALAALAEAERRRSVEGSASSGGTATRGAAVIYSASGAVE
jgi:hypothetical protein